MHWKNTTFLFDVLQINPFEGGLKEVFESSMVVKVFHDFCEDCAGLVRHYGVVCRQVFDT